MKKSHPYMDSSQISMDCMIRTDKCWFRIQTQVPHTSLCYKHMQIFAMKKSVTEKYENKPLFLYLYADHWYQWNTPIFYWWYNIKILIFPHIYRPYIDFTFIFSCLAFSQGFAYCIDICPNSDVSAKSIIYCYLNHLRHW